MSNIDFQNGLAAGLSCGANIAKEVNEFIQELKKILQEKEIILDENASLQEIIQEIEKIDNTCEPGTGGDGTVLKVLYSSLSNENNLVLRGVNE